MADGATIDHKALSVIYGVHRVAGRAKGEYLNVDYVSDALQMDVGVDGEGIYVSNDDLSAIVTVTIMQSSRTNDVFSSILKLQRSTPGGALLPLSIVERNGRTVYSAARAGIQKSAAGTWSDGASVRTWTLITTRLLGFVGGLDATPLLDNPPA